MGKTSITRRWFGIDKKKQKNNDVKKMALSVACKQKTT